MDGIAPITGTGADGMGAKCSLRISQPCAGNERFLLKLTQTTSLGVVTTLETHTVSLAEEAKDDMGRLCYLPTALEARSK